MGNAGSSLDETTVDCLDVFQRGVRLKVLLMICDDIKAGRLNLVKEKQNPSHGEQLVYGLVKPITETKKCSYAKHIHDNDNTRDLVGECNVFVSHPWSADFQLTVSAIVE